MSRDYPLEDGRMSPDEATVILDTRFGPDYISVNQGAHIDGYKIVTLELDATTDPIGGFSRVSVAFHADQDLQELRALRDALDSAITYLED